MENLLFNDVGGENMWNDCPHKGNCSSYPHRCHRCAKGNHRRDFFEPKKPRPYMDFYYDDKTTTPRFMCCLR